MAWVERCAQEYNRAVKFESDFQGNRLKPLTRSKFSPKVKT